MASKSSLVNEITKPQSILSRSVVRTVLHDGFEVEKFVDNVTWQCLNYNADNFNPVRLRDTFERSVADMVDLRAEMVERERLAEAACRAEEAEHRRRLVEVKKQFDVLLSDYRKLDERIHIVAAKVVHLGDQLEGANAPRMRVHEARCLLHEYFRFMSDETYSLDQTPENMELIHKLNTLASELPPGGLYDVARRRISAVHDRLEVGLLEEFRLAEAQQRGAHMKQLVESVTAGHSKAYASCVDHVVQQALKNIRLQTDRMQDELLGSIVATQERVKGVFTQVDHVMAKFLQALFSQKIATYVNAKLRASDRKAELGLYLVQLNELYKNVHELADKLTSEQSGVSVDPALVHKLKKELFQKYVDTYPDSEISFLEQRLDAELGACYADIGHQKTNLSAGGWRAELRNLRILNADVDEAEADKVLLSETFAANIIQEIRMACQRCQKLSNPSQLSQNALRIHEILVRFLVEEHIDYGVEHALRVLPPAEPRSRPSLNFLRVARDANHLYHMFETLFHKSILPLLSSEKQRECASKKTAMAKQLEQKIAVGIEKTLNAVIGHANVLLSEQKKSDYRPELLAGDVDGEGKAGEGSITSTVEQQSLNANGSVTADKVRLYMSAVLTEIQETLDGANRDCVLTELGLRFHRAIVDHLYNFHYSKEGGQMAVLDVHKYDEIVRPLNLPLVTEAFSLLKSLVVLLIVSHVPDCYEKLLTMLPKDVVYSFVQLRLDFKTAKLATQLSQIRG